MINTEHVAAMSVCYRFSLNNVLGEAADDQTLLMAPRIELLDKNVSTGSRHAN